MWSLVGVFTHLTRDTFSSSDSPYFNAWLAAFVVTVAAVGMLGYRKISGQYYAKAPKGGPKGSEAKVQ